MFQCVYSIQCLDENIKEFYIGSTDNFNKRVKSHKDDYNSGRNVKVYNFIRENGGISNWEINYIQKFKFLTKEELRQYEQRYLDDYKPELNANRAYITEEQKIEEQKIYSKEYRIKYSEKLKNQKKDNYEKHKEQILLKKKEYYQKNKDIINLKKKEKYKEKLKEKLKEKSNCPHCDLEMRKDCIKRHIKTKHPTST